MNSKGQYVDTKGNVVSINQRVRNEEFIDFTNVWGAPVNGVNPSIPVLVKPINYQYGDKYNEKPY